LPFNFIYITFKTPSKIEAVQLPSGELLVTADNGSPPKTKDEIIQKKIRIYNVPRSTIEKWIEREYIDIVDSNSYESK